MIGIDLCYVQSQETKIAPENGWWEDYFPFGFRPIFRCEHVSFRERIYKWDYSRNDFDVEFMKGMKSQLVFVSLSFNHICQEPMIWNL